MGDDSTGDIGEITADVAGETRDLLIKRYSGRNGWSWRVAFFPSPEAAYAHEMDDWESGSQIDSLPPKQCAFTGPTALCFKRSEVVVCHITSVVDKGHGGNLGNR